MRLEPAVLRSRIKHSTTEPICWLVFKANFFAKKNKKNQEYLAPSECQKCWVKIRADRIKIRTDRSWPGYKLFAKTKVYKYSDILLVLIYCWLLLQLWDSVIVQCFVVRYFMSILVLQLCLVRLPGVSWLFCGSSSQWHWFVCSLWLWVFLIILTYYSCKRFVLEEL